MKVFGKLRDATEKALLRNLDASEEDAAKQSAAAFGEEVNPWIGSLLLEIFTIRNWIVRYVEMPEEERPPVPWQSLDDSEQPEMEPLAFLESEMDYLLAAYERANRAAILFCDVAFYEQVTHCARLATDAQSRTVENLQWLSSWRMASLQNRHEPPPAGDVAKWFNGPGPYQAASPKDATGACGRVDLNLPLAEGRRGKKRGKKK